MNVIIKNLILSVSILISFHDILHAMITPEDISIYNDLTREDLKEAVDYLKNLQKETETKKNQKSLQKPEDNQKFVTFSERLKSYNIDESTIEEFAGHPFNRFQDSTPYVYCQQPFTTQFFNFIQKFFLGSSAQELTNACRLLRLSKNSSSVQNFNDIDNIISNLPDNLKNQELHIPRYVSNITIQKKDIYTENDDLKRDYPDKVSFTIDNATINYTIEMNSLINEQDPKRIPNRLFKACAIIENDILIKRPLRNFFINILGYTGLLLPYCKEILPYCKDKNNSSLAAVGCLTTILVAGYLKRYFERKEEEVCKLRAEKASCQKSVDYNYEWGYTCLEEFAGKKDGKSYILNISSIKPIIPEM